MCATVAGSNKRRGRISIGWGRFYPIAPAKTGEDLYEAIFSSVGGPDDHEDCAGTGVSRE
jgi:hypothetical protein